MREEEPILSTDNIVNKDEEGSVSPEIVSLRVENVRVRIGSSVTYQEEGYEVPEKVILVHVVEKARLLKDLRYVSDKSPLGSALKYMRVGDEVTVNAPDPYNIKIIEIDNSPD